MSDIRFALRMLAKAPVLSLVVVLSLALGIGTNTAIFSLLHQMLLRAMPIQEPDRVVTFYHPGPVQGTVWSDEDNMPAFPYPLFKDLQKAQAPFTGIAASRGFSANVSYQNAPISGRTTLVSGNYFELLGVKPALGRLILPRDEQGPGHEPVAVLGHGYWTRTLGARPDVLNQPMIVNGFSVTIVGVAQKDFTGDTLGAIPDVYLPVTLKAAITPSWDGLNDRKAYWLCLFGRLKPGLRIQQAAEQINIPYKAILAEDAKLLVQPTQQTLDRFLAKKILLVPLSSGRGGLRSEAKAPLTILLAVTAFVLLIACANAANLLLARSTGRRKEIAIRLSIGASRALLIRQLLIESTILSLAGGAVGLLAAQWTLAAIVAAIPSRDGAFLHTSLDPQVLLYSLSASLLTGLGFGLFPALQATRTGVSGVLKDAGDQAIISRSARFFRDALVAGQMALSLMILVIAGLLLTSLLKLTRVELGFSTDNLITFTVSPNLSGYKGKRALAFYEAIEDRMRSIPGVTAVGGSTVALVSGNNWSTNIRVEGQPEVKGDKANANLSKVNPGFFASVGIPLILGREFTSADSLGSKRVAIVNQTFASRHFGDQNPIGRRFSDSFKPGVGFDIEIVGLVKDSVYSNLQTAKRTVFYLPYRQDERVGSLSYYLRTPLDPNYVFPQIRREVAAADSAVPVDELKTMRTQVDENVFAERLLSTLTLTFAVLATLLASIGLYGVLAYTVARRTREIGIRMALGAASADVRKMIFRDVLALTITGASLGLAGALAAADILQSLLYGVKARDPFVLALCSTVLVSVALLAGLLPARRATRIEPMTALRYE